MSDKENWTQWSKYVIITIDEIKSDIKSLNNKVENISNDIASLQVKAGFWGALAGMIPVLILILIKYL